MRTLEKELTELLNRWSQENNSDTPDFILASYLLDCLRAFNVASNKRSEWYGADATSSQPLRKDV